MDWPIAAIFGRSPTMRCRPIGWLQAHGVEFVTPVYYLSAGPARIQPVGGGSAIVEKLLAAAEAQG